MRTRKVRTLGIGPAARTRTQIQTVWLSPLHPCLASCLARVLRIEARRGGHLRQRRPWATKCEALEQQFGTC